MDVTKVRQQIQSLAFYGGAYALLLGGVVAGVSYRPFNVLDGADQSMAPGIAGGDRFAYNRRDADLSRLRRRDVVCWKASPNDDRVLVGRLVALPGDLFEVRRGRIWLRPSGGGAIEEVHEPEISQHAKTWEQPPVLVPRGHVVILADNRAWDSWSRVRPLDSRTLGPVRAESIRGKVSR